MYVSCSVYAFMALALDCPGSRKFSILINELGYFSFAVLYKDYMFLKVLKKSAYKSRGLVFLVCRFLTTASISLIGC